MSDEPLRDSLDADDLLEDLDLVEVALNHLSANDDQGIGKRVGGAAGEVIGREIGKILGERFVDPLVAEDEPTEDEEQEEDEEDSEAAEEDVEIEDADDLINAVAKILDEEDDGSDDPPDEEGDQDPSAGPDIASREALEELSYRELQQIAKEVDVKANLARDEMTEELVETLDLEA